MLHLTRTDGGGKFFLLSNIEYKIGSSVGHHDLPIEGLVNAKKDTSISRRHALLKVKYCEEDQAVIERFPEVSLSDLNSTYGTYINEGIDSNSKISVNHFFTIRATDKIRFGKQWNVWQLSVTPLIVISSNLSKDLNSEIRENVFKLGGHVVESWSSKCTHLTMGTIKMTAKVVNALATGIPIVTPDYWKALLNAITLQKEPNGFMTQRSLPNPEDFLPLVNEPMLTEKDSSLFAVNPDRKVLFKGKTFMFPGRKVFHRMMDSVIAAGGIAVTLDNCNITAKQICCDNVLVVHHSLSNTQNQDSFIPDDYSHIQELLLSKKMRTIPESEIGLAILYNSLETNCNPYFNPETLIRIRRDTSIEHTQVVLAHDTPDTQALSPHNVDVQKRSNIMESVELHDGDDDNSSTSKDFTSASTSKRIRLDTSIETNEDKRCTISQLPLKKPSLPIGSILTFKDVDAEFLSVSKTTQKKRTDVSIISSDHVKNKSRSSCTQSSSPVRKQLQSAKCSDDEEDVFGFEHTDLSKYIAETSTQKSLLNTRSSTAKYSTDVKSNLHSIRKKSRDNSQSESDSEVVRPVKIRKLDGSDESDEDVFKFDSVEMKSTSIASKILCTSQKQSTPKTESDTNKVEPRSVPKISENQQIPSNVDVVSEEWLEIPQFKQEPLETSSAGEENCGVTFVIRFFNTPVAAQVPSRSGGITNDSTQSNNLLSLVNYKKFSKSHHPEIEQGLPNIISCETMAKLDIRSEKLMIEDTEMEGNQDDQQDVDWAFQDLDLISRSNIRNPSAKRTKK